jgi:hypothetical protein
MRAISNRIRRLERILVPPVLEEGQSAAEILWARRRRRAEAAGQPYPPEPLRSWTGPPCWAVSLVDVLRGRYRDEPPPP